MTGDGDKLNITVGFTAPSATSTESVNLMFDLMATSDQEDLMLPLDEGVVEVWVTMAPDEAADMPDGTTEDEYFAVNYIPADGVHGVHYRPGVVHAAVSVCGLSSRRDATVEYSHSHHQSECLHRYSAEWNHQVHPVPERRGDDRVLNGR